MSVSLPDDRRGEQCNSACCRNLKTPYMLGDGKTSPTALCGCGRLTMVSATASSGPDRRIGIPFLQTISAWSS